MTIIFSILYGIGGVLIVFCIVMLAIVIKAYKHPERFGPWSGNDERPSQTTIQGISQAILDTLPSVLFRDTEIARTQNTSVKSEGRKQESAAVFILSGIS
jgi:hypothetical protein